MEHHADTAMFIHGIVNSNPVPGIHPSKAEFENQHWTNLVLHRINGVMGMCPWKFKVNKQKNHKYTVMIFNYEQIV
jgi:hypothetical protein